MPRLNDRLGTGVDGGGRLIEDHDRRIGHRSTGDGEQLTLALGQAAAVAGQHECLIAVRQAADEIVRIGKLRRCDTISSSVASSLP